MFYWIYDVPLWLLGICFTVAFVGLTWAAILLTRPWMRRWIGPEHGWNHLVGHMIASHGVLYGILLALLALGAFENHAEVEKAVAMEASRLGALYRDVSSYPEPLRGKLMGSLQDYCRYVIEEAWPAQRRGIILHGGVVRVGAFQRMLVGFQPENKSQEILHAETMQQFNSFVAARHQRLHAITSGLPGVMWWVLAVGGLLGIGLTCMLTLRRLTVHLALAGTLSLLTAMVVFLLAAMDHPLRGSVRITPEAFEIVLKDLMTEEPGGAEKPERP